MEYEKEHPEGADMNAAGNSCPWKIVSFQNSSSCTLGKTLFPSIILPLENKARVSYASEHILNFPSFFFIPMLKRYNPDLNL